jgi:hypothetical protein
MAGPGGEKGRRLAQAAGSFCSVVGDPWLPDGVVREAADVSLTSGAVHVLPLASWASIRRPWQTKGDGLLTAALRACWSGDLAIACVRLAALQGGRGYQIEDVSSGVARYGVSAPLSEVARRLAGLAWYLSSERE